MTDEYCNGCAYLSSIKSCDYCLYEFNGVRGCKAGTGCNKKYIGDRTSLLYRQYKNGTDITYPKEFKPKLNYKDEAKRLELYQQGMSDRAIADETNVSVNSIRRWRYSRNLKSKKIQNIPKIVVQKEKKPQSRLTKEEEEVRMSLYNAGYSDNNIAKMIGVQVSSIRKWRLRRGLETNYTFEYRSRLKRGQGRGE